MAGRGAEPDAVRLEVEELHHGDDELDLAMVRLQEGRGRASLRRPVVARSPPHPR
jgi:hypothetical protein